MSTNESDGIAEKLLRFLQQKLEPTLFAKIERAINGGQSATTTDNNATDPDAIERATKFLRARGLGQDDVEHAIALASKTPPGEDADPGAAESISDEVIAKVLAALKGLLEPSVYAQVAEALSNVSESAVEAPPATFAADSFYRRWPEALRIDVSAGPTPRKSARSPNFSGFAERFPEAERIGGV